MRAHDLVLEYRLTADAVADRVAAVDLEHPLFHMLDALHAAGSVQHAAERLGVSYRHLWGSLRQWEQRLGEPLVAWVRGQPARLTAQGRERLGAQRLARARLRPQVETIRQELLEALRPGAPGDLPALDLACEHDPVWIALRERAWDEARLALRLHFRPEDDGLRAVSAGRLPALGLASAVSSPGAPPPLEEVGDAPGRAVRTACARRRQGLMLAPGNPLAMTRLEEAFVPGRRFVAGEPGTASRRLAQALLGRSGLPPDRLAACPTEPTAEAAAVAIALGQADAALGPGAAAEAGGLDFLPLDDEGLWLVCTREGLDDPRLRALLAVLAGSGWRRHLAASPDGAPMAGAGLPMSWPLEPTAA